MHLGKKDIILSRFGLNTSFLKMNKDGLATIKMTNMTMEPDAIQKKKQFAIFTVKLFFKSMCEKCTQPEDELCSECQWKLGP